MFPLVMSCSESRWSMCCTCLLMYSTTLASWEGSVAVLSPIRFLHKNSGGGSSMRLGGLKDLHTAEGST